MIRARTNGKANTRDAGDLRRYRIHYDVTVMHKEKHDQFGPSEIYVYKKSAVRIHTCSRAPKGLMPPLAEEEGDMNPVSITLSSLISWYLISW